MLKNNKSLAVAIVVILLVAGAAFLLKGKMTSETPVAEAGAETTEQLSTPASAPAAPTETATAETAAPADAPAAAAATEMSTPATAAPAPAVAATTDPASTAAAAPADTGPIVSADGLVDVKKAMADRVLGSDNAPVTIIEYASLTCPHCAFFATTNLAAVKEKLIDTGKLRLVFRDFPLDQFAMKAAKMARCVEPAKYFDLIEVLFKNQDRWTHADDKINALIQLGSLAGMDETTMKSCINNDELENAIAVGVNEAQSKFDVKATPTFVVNYGAENFTGAQDVTKFEEVVNRLSAGK